MKMKYLLSFLVSTASLILSASGKIPDFIHVCKRNDPQLQKCIKNSILNVREHLVTGIPELRVPPIDPLYLDYLDMNIGPGFNAEARNVTAIGAKDFQIGDLTVDIKANTYTFTFVVPKIHAVGTYQIDAKIGAIPLKGRGPMTFIAKSLFGRGTFHGKKVARDGETYYWFPTMNLKLEIEDYEIKLDNLFDGDATIGEVTNTLLNSEKKEVLATMLPGLEKGLIQYFLAAANNICKNFTWDELFPET